MKDTLEKGRPFGDWLKPQVLVTIILIVVVIAAAAVLYFSQRNETVAVVNGVKITKDELYRAMLEQGGKETLDQIITRMLIEQEGKKRDITVSDEEIDAEIEKLIDANFHGDRAYFDQVLEQYGITAEVIAQDVRMDLTARKLAAAGLEFTEEELEEYFSENRAKFDVPEEIEARHILVETEEEAEEILALLREGADFAELARERSEDTASAADGGNLGFFPRGKMLAAFDEAAFALEQGEYSEPVKTAYGFHVIELLDRKPGREVSFAEVREDVLVEMNEAELPALVQELVASLWDSATVTYK